MSKNTQFTGQTTAAPIYKITRTAHQFTIENLRAPANHDYSFDNPASISWWLSPELNIQTVATYDGAILTVDATQPGALEGLRTFLMHNSGVVSDGTSLFVMVGIEIALRAARLASAQRDALRREPRPEWRFTTNINEDNVWFLRTMDYEESVRGGYVESLVPADRIIFSADNRELRIRLTSVADLDNFVVPFLDECRSQIEPEQKTRIDERVTQLRQELPPLPIPATLLMTGFSMVSQMLGSWGNTVMNLTRAPLLNSASSSSRVEPPLTHEQRLVNIKAHPKFHSMIDNMLEKGTLTQAANIPITHREGQFAEHIAKWLDPVSHDLVENPVTLPLGTLVDQTTFQIIMGFAAQGQRIDPVTVQPIPAGYQPAKAPNIVRDIRKFLDDCEQELQTLSARPLPNIANFFW